MSSPGVDFLTQYKSISSKLKKRFLRKPNIAEASEQFSTLAKQLQQQECPQYAAFSCLALARCEQTIGNSTGEAQALIQGARLFLEEERHNLDLRCPIFNEHLNSAINCYNHAIRVYLEQKHFSLAASLCIELGNSIKKFNKISEAITYYQRGADLLTKSPLECLNALDLLSSCYIEIGDYDRGLTLLSDMTEIIEQKGHSCGGRLIGAFSDYFVKCEITRVLVLLLLCPGLQRLQQEHSQLLEKYAWETTDFESTASYLGEDLFLLMQSVVMAHQSDDIESLKALQTDLWPLLSAQQNDLLQLVVKNICQRLG